MAVGLLGNESPDSNRFIPVVPKSENDVRLQATLGNQNPTGLPVGAVRVTTAVVTSLIIDIFFSDIALLGASGIVFSFILLASFAGFKEGEIPFLE